MEITARARSTHAESTIADLILVEVTPTRISGQARSFSLSFHVPGGRPSAYWRSLSTLAETSFAAALGRAIPHGMYLPVY
jgi:hypothetical protein